MPRVIIAGCGFLGLATARLFHAAGWEVLGLTHSPESTAKLAGESFRAVAVEISREEAVRSLGKEHRPEIIVHCASSGRGGAEQYEAVYLRGTRHLLEVLEPGRFIFTSSTSVYAQVNGEIVTEESAAEPERETGRILRRAEELVLRHEGVVARVAGLYGPGRSVLLRKFFAGEAVIEAGGKRMINQIHRDDAAAALLALANANEPGIYNVVDDTAISQLELYRQLATRFGMSLPPDGAMDLNRKRGWTSKRVSNAKLRSMGWVPRYPSFLDALDADPMLVSLARTSAGQ